MLPDEQLMAFMGTSNAAVSRAFFEGVLGLTFVADTEHLLIFDSGAARLMLQKTDVVTPPHGTSVGWRVKNLSVSMKELAERGVAFERFSGMDQDEMGVWRPDGPSTGVCWFKDPDGNLLSLTQASVD